MSERSTLGIVSAVIGCGLALVRCGLADSERHQRDLAFSHPIEMSLPSASAASYTRTNMPGMSAMLPGSATPEGEYNAGSIQSTYPVQYAITWQLGDAIDESDREMATAAMIKGVRDAANVTLTVTGKKQLKVGGHDANQIEFAAPTGEVAVIVFTTCGSRIVQFTLAGLSDTAATASRMLDSFECTPDPAKEKAPRDELAVAKRSGWSRVKSNGTLILEDKAGDRILGMGMANPGLPLDTVVERTLTMGGYALHGGAPHGSKSFWTGSLTVEGETQSVAVLAWACGKRVETITVTNGSKAGIALAETGRCLGADEATPTY